MPLNEKHSTQLTHRITDTAQTAKLTNEPHRPFNRAASYSTEYNEQQVTDSSTAVYTFSLSILNLFWPKGSKVSNGAGLVSSIWTSSGLSCPK